MGGCATKPKVSKGEAASEAPVPAPEPAVKEDQETAAAASEPPVLAPEPAAKEDQAVAAAAAVDDQEKEKEVVLVADSDEAEKKIEITPEPEPEPEEAQGGGDDKAKEIVDDDGQGSKRRSLSLLFKCFPSDSQPLRYFSLKDDYKNVEGKEELTEPEKQLEPGKPLEEKTHDAPTDIAIEDASAASEKVAEAVTETADQATKEVKVAAAEEAK